MPKLNEQGNSKAIPWQKIPKQAGTKSEKITHCYRQRHTCQLRFPQVTAEHHADEADQEGHQLWNELKNKIMFPHFRNYKNTNEFCQMFSTYWDFKRPGGMQKLFMALAADVLCFGFASAPLCFWTSFTTSFSSEKIALVIAGVGFWQPLASKGLHKRKLNVCIHQVLGLCDE